MKNYLQALRFSWPYRGRVIASIVCAIVAALFWSLNFTAIYPVLNTIGADQNLQTWVNQSIQKVNEQIEPLEKEMAEASRKSAAVRNAPEVQDREREERGGVLRPGPARIEAGEPAASALPSAKGQVLHRHVCTGLLLSKMLAVIIGLIVADHVFQRVLRVLAGNTGWQRREQVDVRHAQPLLSQASFTRTSANSRNRARMNSCCASRTTSRCWARGPRRSLAGWWHRTATCDRLRCCGMLYAVGSSRSCFWCWCQSGFMCSCAWAG